MTKLRILLLPAVLLFTLTVFLALWPLAMCSAFLGIDKVFDGLLDVFEASLDAWSWCLDGWRQP